MNIESGLLTVPEAARALRLQQSTIRSWLLKKKLGHLKLGRRVFVRRADLDALVERAYVPASSEMRGRLGSLGAPLVAV